MPSTRVGLRSTWLAFLVCTAAMSHAIAATSHPEVEPNDTPATATPLRFHGTAAVATGSIIPAGDFDFYSFEVPSVAEVWILADSGGPQNAGANSRDTLITLYASDGTTVIEFDNNDGTGNGGDGTIETLDSSALANVFILNPGTYYVRVAGFQVSDAIDPYTLFVLVTYGGQPGEVEPNGTFVSATPLVPGSGAFGMRSGQINPVGDVDFYSVNALEGDTLFFSLDADPERDGSTNLVVDLIDRDGSTVLLTADSSNNPDAAAESANFVLPNAGTYYLRVHHAGAGPGTYAFAAALLPQYGSCITTITSALGQDSDDYPAVHGVHTNRTAQVAPTHCAFSFGCPPLILDPGFHAYDAYTFFNHGDEPECVSVQVEAPACPDEHNIVVFAYQGSFSPDDLCAGYAGDIGVSPEPDGTFSFVAAPFQNYVVVVSEVTPGAGCSAYTLRVTQTCPSGLVIDQHVAPGTASNHNGVLESGETVFVDPLWRGLAGGALSGAVVGFDGPSGATYSVNDAVADYGASIDGEVADCLAATQDCYELSVSGARPTPHWDSEFYESLSDGRSATWSVHIGASFSDVPPTNLFYPFIENLFHNEVTGGGSCGGYCPDAPALRKQMAVFVLKAKEGPGYVPPPATGVFADVPVDDPFAPWIEELYHRGVVAGCVTGAAEGSISYCPNAPVLRQQMSVFLLRTLLGSSYVPPPAGGLFSDVPVSSPFAPFVEDLVNRGIAAGCGGGNFCPTNLNLRKQMAPFLVKTFGLVLYGH